MRRECVFQMVEQRVRSMKTIVAQIQRCKLGLGLPGNAEETLTVFTVVNQLQTLLLDLEKVPGSVPIGSIFFYFNQLPTSASLFCRKFQLCSASSLWIRPGPEPGQRSGPVPILQSQNPHSWRLRSAPPLK